MRFWGLAACFGLIAWSVKAESSGASSVDRLPECAQLCLGSAISDSGCLPTDQACICTDESLLKHVEECVVSACTPKQVLTTMNITTTTCHIPTRNRGETFNTMSLVLGTFTAVIVFIRIMYHYVSSASGLGWDDWLIVITLSVGICGNIINSVGFIANGLGRDVWTIPFEQLTAFIRWFYIQEILYFLQIATLKASILFFYFRIFGQSSIRNLIIATLVVNAVYGVVFVFLAIFQCRPISYYWTKWQSEAQGKCLNINGIAWANAIISIVVDLWMLALPIFQVKSLNMDWRKKLGVSMMFCVGIFVTIVSILRLQSLVVFSETHNPTWDQYSVAYWSTIEMNVGIICACMPALRLVLVRLFPRIMGTYKRSLGYHTSPLGRSQGDSRGNANSRKRGDEPVIRSRAVEDRGVTAQSSGSDDNNGQPDVVSDHHDETRLIVMKDLA